MCHCLLFTVDIRTCLDNRSALCSPWAAFEREVFFFNIQTILQTHTSASVSRLCWVAVGSFSFIRSFKDLQKSKQCFFQRCLEETAEGRWRKRKVEWIGDEWRRRGEKMTDDDALTGWSKGGRKREGVKIAVRTKRSRTGRCEARVNEAPSQHVDVGHTSLMGRFVHWLHRAWCVRARVEVNGAKLRYKWGLCEQWSLCSTWAPVCVHLQYVG